MNNIRTVTDHANSSNIGPRSCNRFAHWLGRTVMRVFGWQLNGGVPDARNMVIIAAPHTSNWDFIHLMAAAYSLGVSINWLAKDSLFFFPLGKLLRAMGGIPVDRSKPNSLVQLLADRIATDKGTAIVVPAPGTRSRTEYWKSGFYRIAESAQIPIVCGYLDYAKKEAGLGLCFHVTDLRQDMDRIRAFYEPITPKIPENKSRIRLREEDE